MQDFRNLKVWQEAHELVLELYHLTQTFPKDEIYGLTSQIRRAAASIPTNLSEGCGRSSDVDFARFAQIAFGPACELEYHLILAKDLGYLTESASLPIHQRLESIKRMLASLLKKLRADSR